MRTCPSLVWTVSAWLAVWLCGPSADAVGQNSTRKVRTAPSELAAKVGTAVPWLDTVGEALAKSKETGRPVFWYVGEVSGSPMDRKPEIDRYQRGGPFSWPSTIELLRDHFVCTDEVAKGELQKQYELVRNRFIEPGYLVLAADGTTLLAVAEITTLQPEWYEAPLRRLVKQPREGFPGAAALREAWAAYRAGEWGVASERSAKVAEQDLPSATLAEARWLHGAAMCRSGDRAAAEVVWRELAAALPDEPLAWKAALEVEGHGPFVRGFEDYLPLPEEATLRDPDAGSRLAGVFDEGELWRRSTAFLLRMHDDGVYRDSAYDFGGTDSLPNVHAAVTCLAGMALLAVERRVAAGTLALEAPLQARLQSTLLRIRERAASDAWLAESDRDEILWARAYALRFLAAWQAAKPDEADATRPALQNAVGALLALQPDTGVWFHEYGNPFAIATALQALAEARAAGIEVEQEKIDRGLRALAQNRTPQGAFTYNHTRRGQPRAPVEGAAGRMPLCELGLFVFGASSQEKLLAAVDAGFRHHELLAAVRKYDDHADRLGYGGFFFWFDMLGRVEAALRIEDAAGRSERLAAMRDLVMDLPEIDGCFVDSHELGRVYGTAMALLCLERCATK